MNAFLLLLIGFVLGGFFAAPLLVSSINLLTFAYFRFTIWCKRGMKAGVRVHDFLTFSGKRKTIFFARSSEAETVLQEYAPSVNAKRNIFGGWIVDKENYFDYYHKIGHHPTIPQMLTSEMRI